MTDETRKAAGHAREEGPADAMQAFYETVLQSAGAVVQNGEAYQAELNKAGGAMLTSSVTHMMTVVNAATARAVAVMAASAASPQPHPHPHPAPHPQPTPQPTL